MSALPVFAAIAPSLAPVTVQPARRTEPKWGVRAPRRAALDPIGRVAADWGVVYKLASRRKEFYAAFRLAYDAYIRTGLSTQRTYRMRVTPYHLLPTTEVLSRWFGANNPLTLAPYRRVWRRVAVEGWRRWLCRVGRMRRALGLPLTERIHWADVRVDRFRLHARYRPDPVRTPTVLFNAVEPLTDTAATWRSVFDGPLTVIDTPDPHLDDDSVAAARRIILEHLDELEDA